MRSKEFGVGFPRDDFSSQGSQVVVADLAINGSISIGLRPFDQVNKTEFRSIAFEGEHAFAEKHASNGHPVESADQFILTPCFERMRKS